MRPLVLVVDDDEAIAGMLVLFLSGKYEVVATNSVEDATKIIKEGSRKFDLIITDYNLPGSTGWSLATSCTTIMNTPVIVITGDYLHEPPLGNAKVLMKPFTLSELSSLIEEMLT
jgi:DNA-binding response OmpR family regulator